MTEKQSYDSQQSREDNVKFGTRGLLNIEQRFADPFSRSTISLTIAFFVVVSAILRLIVAFRPLEYIDGLTIPDDAYLCLTIARNIAKGFGPVYGHDFTNGFQPLYVYMITPVFIIFPDNPEASIRFALTLLTFFDTLSLFLLTKFLRERFRSDLIALIVAISWCVNPFIIRTTLNGMETMVSFFFVVCVFYFFTNRQNSIIDTRNAFLLGCLVGLATLARIDNVFLGVTMVVMFFVLLLKNQEQLSKIIRPIAVMVAGAVLITLAWLLYSYVYTGDLIPVSGKASRYISLTMLEDWAGNPLLLSFEHGARAIGRSHPVYLWTMLGMCGFLLLRKNENGIWRKSYEFLLNHQSLLLYAILLFLAYVFFVLTFWYFDRYFFPILIVIVVGFSFLLERFLKSFTTGRAQMIAAIAVIAVVVSGNVGSSSFRDLFFSTDTTSLGYRNLGLWAKRSFKDGTVVGASQSGALGYFATNLSVLNIDGVVNKECYESFLQKQHLEYLRKENVEYVVGWRRNIDFMVRQSRNFTEKDTIDLGRIEGFTSWRIPWYLVKICGTNADVVR